MSERSNSTMNLKINNEVKAINTVKSRDSIIKEERRRTGRYIAILVGILLFILAFYHAWVRRIPVVASLVVPALIMFVYVAWVLYTASRDKHKFQMLDAEAALNAASPTGTDNDVHISELTQNNLDISGKDNTSISSPDDNKEAPLTLPKENNIRTEVEHNFLTMPIILVNDKPPEDFDQKWVNIVETVSNNEKFKAFHTRRKFKRKFCRSRRHAVFKRSYSIG